MRQLEHQKRKKVLFMKKFILNSTILLGILSLNIVANAEIKNDTMQEYYLTQEVDSHILTHEELIADGYVLADNQSRDTGYTYYKDTKISSERKNNIWVGYHSGTPNWAKASSYTLTKSKGYSVSGSYSYYGISVNTGFSYSKSVATTFKANSKKYSRLGVRGDFTFTKIKRQYYNSDSGAIGKPSYYVTTQRHNYYLAPVYK